MFFDHVSNPLIIIGCHRSGTSLVSQIIASLGVDMGSTTGHWEDPWFLDFNEGLLRSYRASWFEPVMIDSCGAEEVKNIYGYVRRKPRFWGWKDPRNSYVLPFWLRLFPKARILWVHRNGIDVANSLMQREKKRDPRHPLYAKRCLNFMGAYSLWAQYEEACAVSVRSVDNANLHHICFEQLCVDSDRVIKMLVEFLQLDLPKNIGEKLPEISINKAWSFNRKEISPSNRFTI